MRISLQARAIAERPSGRAREVARQTKLPRRYGRVLITSAYMVVGAVGGGVYAQAVAGRPDLFTIGLAALGGVAAGYLVVAVPQLAIHFLLKQWYRLLSRRWQQIEEDRAERAVRALQERQDDPRALADLGIAHYLLGAAHQAVDYMTQACQQAGESPDLLNALAAAEAAQGHWEQAAATLSSAVQLQADHAPTLSNLGTLLATIPAGSELEAYLSSALPAGGARAMNNLAVREIRAGNTQEALAHLEQALARQPHYPHPQANLGVLAFAKGDLQAATVNLAAAAQFGGNDPDILSNLGGVLAKGGDWVRAAAVLRLARRLAPRYVSAAVNEGCVQIELGRYHEAIEGLPTVPADEPLAAFVWHNIAWAYAALGEYKQAREYELKAADARPTDPDIYTTLGCIEWELGDHQQARAHFQYVLEVEPESFQAAINLARAEIAAGHLREALQILEGLQPDHPDDVQLTFDLGVAHLMNAVRLRKDDMNPTEQRLFLYAVDSSIGAFERNLANDQGMAAESQLNLGLAHYLRENYDIAAHQCQQALKLLPEDTQIHLCAGTALAQEAARVQEHHEGAPGALAPPARRLLRQARVHLRKAAEDTQAGPDVFCNLGLVCYQLDEFEEAVKALRRFVQVESGAEAHNNLALVYGRQGLQVYRRSRVGRLADEIKSNPLVDQARRLLSTAIHYFSEALRIDHLNPVMHSNIGLAYMLRNRPTDVERALDHWQLMRRAGGEWAERQFERLMQFVHSQETAKAEFHDVHMALRPVSIPEFISGLPPLMGDLVYVVEPMMDRGQWELEATDPNVQFALRARRRVAELQHRLQRLAV